LDVQVARGLMSHETLADIHAELLLQLEAQVFICNDFQIETLWQ
jgi:hypothetical protein